ncbi:MAG: zinc ribbon domain-containing protein [Oscillospiraceae bacterium]|nr:zinc ribbon domain-containing protein [Oscillospiraceae bacterium]
MFCSKCGNSVEDSAAFCSKCGNKMEAAPSFCSGCGSPLDPSAAFCPKCGTKSGSAASAQTEPETVIKSKKECIYDAMCNYMRATVLITGVNPTFGELENYEEGKDGKVYCELVASTRNAFGQTKKTRYGAVVKEVEADGNCVFQTPGPQLITLITPTKVCKKVLGFKSL